MGQWSNWSRFRWVTSVMGQCPLTHHDPCWYFAHSQTRFSLSEIKGQVAHRDTLLGPSRILVMVLTSYCNTVFISTDGVDVWTFVQYNVICVNFLPVLLHRWSGVRKSIRPVKLSDEVLMKLTLWSEVQIVYIYVTMPLPPQNPIFTRLI